MKKLILFAALLASAVAFSQNSNSYVGNGKSSFGGAVGLGSLIVRDSTDTVSVTLIKGPGPFDSLIVVYLDIQAGGISSTAVLPGSSTDRYQAAVTGNNLTGSAVLNFPTDFQPEAAVVFDKDSGKVYAFATFPIIGTFFSIRDSFLVRGSGDTFTGGSSKARLNLTPGPLSFKFVGTYIGKSASRSNESFGDPFDTYSRNSGTYSYNPYTITSYFTFTSGTLPVKLIDFKAAKQGDIVNIFWSVADETNIDKYEIQRSSDGISFSTIASVKARNSSLFLSYTAKDVSAQNGINYYRVVIVEREKSEISRVVSLNMERIKTSFIASYTGGGNLSITLNALKSGAYKLRILNNNGQLLQAEDVKADGTYQSMQIRLNPKVTKGIYRVALQSGNAGYTANILVP